MKKLYLKKSGRPTHYHEAWDEGSTIIEHWGELGTNGETIEHKIKKPFGGKRSLEEVLSAAAYRGYVEIEEEDHAILIIEHNIKDIDPTEALSARHQLEDEMDNLLGWTGLGHCDGGSIGMGVSEVCCLVVDYGFAEKVVAKFLEKDAYPNLKRIYEETDG